MDGKMLHLKWFVRCDLTNKSNDRKWLQQNFYLKKSEFVNLEFSIQMILSVTKITEEDGCSLLCQ